MEEITTLFGCSDHMHGVVSDCQPPRDGGEGGRGTQTSEQRTELDTEGWGLWGCPPTLEAPSKQMREEIGFVLFYTQR